MPNAGKVDTCPEMMKKDHGTTVLITDPRSDYYLWRSTQSKKAPKFVERLKDA
jgi:hypothetical protein